jgi:hypothetical protein
MEIVERYLQAVRIWLPKGQQDDILAELGDSIRSEAEDREAVLGRPLGEDDQSDLIRHYGHPMLLGLRYRPARYLVGPLLFPFYCLALLFGAAAVSVGFLVNAAVAIIAGKPGGEIAHAFTGVFGSLLPMIGWATVVFAGLEWAAGKYKVAETFSRKWNPRTLPKLQKRKEPKKASQSVFGLVAHLGFALWWLAAIQNPWLVFGPAATFLSFGEGIYALYPAFVALALAGVAIDFTELFRPQGELTVRTLRVLQDVGSLAVMALLIQSGEIVVFRGDPSVSTALNSGITLGLTIALVVGSLKLIWELVQIARRPTPATER